MLHWGTIFDKMNRLTLLTLLLYFIFHPIVSFAHPGRTDSSGCHTCKTNCSNWGLSYGEYHCHNSKGVSQPKEPIKSTYGENGTGYVSKAPEYKTQKVNTVKSVNTQQNKKVEEKGNWFSRLLGWN